jgi:hypothetical protein
VTGVSVRVAALAVFAAAATLAVGSAASAASFGFFKTPSGKIVCQWGTGAPAPAIVCGVSTGLKPPIPKTGGVCQHLDYVGNRVALEATGRVQLIACTGDAGPFGDPAHTVYLHYGKTWSAGGLTCSEAVKGLTCRNRDGHGFFLSLRGWRTF